MAVNEGAEAGMSVVRRGAQAGAVLDELAHSGLCFGSCRANE